MSGARTVHLRVNDAATGKPTPVRLCIQGPGKEHYAPLGRFLDFPCGRNEAVGGQVLFGHERHFYIDGTCEIRLPAGAPLQLEISKGPEYRPVREQVVLGPGQMALRFQVERWIDPGRDAWRSGEMRCHFLTPHAALLEGQAEGLGVINLLAAVQDLPGQDGKLYPQAPHIEAFSGTEPVLERAGHVVVVGTFNTHPVLGRLALLNCHRAVYPLTFGGADDTDDWSLADWCDQCHRKKGLAVWADPFQSGAGLLGGEALVDLLLGKVDALEIDARARAQPLLPAWYRLLDAGWRVPLVGASAKDSNRVILGGVRTYAHVAGTEHDSLYASWIEAIRLGRTFATNGPLLRFALNGQPPGATIEIAGDNVPLRIEAAAQSLEPFERLEVVANGSVVAAVRSEGSPGTARIDLEHQLPGGGWVAARCVSGQKGQLYPHLPVFAHTSPVYVHVIGQTPPERAAARGWLRPLVELTRDWVERTGCFASPRSKEHLLHLADEALVRLDVDSRG